MKGRQRRPFNFTYEVCEICFDLQQQIYLSCNTKDNWAAFSVMKGRVLFQSTQEQYNIDAVNRLVANAAPARSDIPAELGAQAIRLEDEVLIPKFQALLAGEITPEDMFAAVKEAAYEVFGEENCAK